MNRFLIATDGSPAADAAVQAGVQLAAEQAGGVVFLRVVEASDVVAPSFGPIVVNPVDLSKPEDDEALAAAAEVARSHGVPFELRLAVGLRLRDDPGHGRRDRRRADRGGLESPRRSRDRVLRQRLQGVGEALPAPGARRPSDAGAGRRNGLRLKRKERI